MNLHDLYANLQELKREESKREIESRHLSSDLHDQVGSAKFFIWQKDTDYQTEITSLKIDGILTNDKEAIDTYVRDHYAKRFIKKMSPEVYMILMLKKCKINSLKMIEIFSRYHLPCLKQENQ